MRGGVIAAAALAVLPASLPAREKPVFVETEAVKDKPAIALDPARAYVLLRSDNATSLYLTKVPSAEDQATYDRLRADAFAEAREKYARKLSQYERDVKARAANPQLPKPEKPTEPTEANFAFTPFALMAGVSIGPINRLAKAGFSTYLQALTPGTYRVYGPVTIISGTAPTGACYCMGSVQFEARAGEITDLGAIPERQPSKRPDGDSSWPGDWGTTAMFAPAAAAMPVDPRLASFKMTPVAWRPAGKMPNYFGLQIARLPEMPGVMRYDRDRIVDLTGR